VYLDRLVHVSFDYLAQFSSSVVNKPPRCAIRLSPLLLLLLLIIIIIMLTHRVIYSME